jgi:hypothetical protein
MVHFAEELFQGIHSVYFGGNDRTAAAVAGFALAKKASPTVFWLNIRSPGSGNDDFEALLQGRVPPALQYHTRVPSQLEPPVSPSAQPRARGIDPEFDPIRLPELVGQLTGRLPSGPPAPVLFVTNSERIAPFYPEHIETTRQFQGLVLSAGLSLVATYAGPPRRDRFAFEYVFRVETMAGRDWRSAMVSAEHGIISPGSAGARPTRLDLIDAVRALGLPS